MKQSLGESTEAASFFVGSGRGFIPWDEAPYAVTRIQAEKRAI